MEYALPGDVARGASPDSQERPRVSSNLRILLVVFLVCTLLALWYAGARYVDYTYGGYELTWWDACIPALVEWWAWVALTPGILWLTRRFPLEQRRWGRAFLVHAPLSVVAGVLQSVCEMAILSFALGRDARVTTGDLAQASLLYWLFVGALHAIDINRRYRERDHEGRLAECDDFCE